MIPEGLDQKTDGALVSSGEVAYRVLKNETKKGQKVGIIGVGAIGSLVVKFGAAMGLEMTAFTTSESKVDLIKSFGAKHVVVTDKEYTCYDALENSLDVLINLLPVTDADLMEKLFLTIKPCGKLIQLGTPGTDEESNITFSFYTLIAKQIEMVGYNNGPSHSIEETLRFAAEHNIHAVAELYDFEELPKIIEKVGNGRPLFKCVLLMEDYAKKHNL